MGRLDGQQLSAEILGWTSGTCFSLPELEMLDLPLAQEVKQAQSGCDSAFPLRLSRQEGRTLIERRYGTVDSECWDAQCAGRWSGTGGDGCRWAERGW